ncbi:MAG: hypothetical protein ACRD9R_21790, partial [Pyrinomonadaceae bacterium]
LKGQAEVRQLIEDCKRAAEEESGRQTSFWNRVAEADAELLSCLINDELPDHKEKVKQLYMQAFSLGANQRDISSVTGQISQVMWMLSAREGTRDSVKALREVLKHISAATTTGGGRPGRRKKSA